MRGGVRSGTGLDGAELDGTERDGGEQDSREQALAGRGGVRAWAAGWAAVAAGALLCVLGWYGVSGERFAERQIPYLASCSIPGAALLVAGALLLAPARTAAPLRGRTGLRPDPVDPAEPRAPSSEEQPLSVAGGRLAHRPDCPLLDGKETFPADASAEPCPVCEPCSPTN